MAGKDQIISLPNPSLRKRSAKIGILTPETKKVVEDMKAATLDWESSRAHEVGVALAAIQIDKPYRLIIIRNNFDDKQDKTFSVFINPEIVKYEGEIEEDFEGCLSVSGTYGKVPRYTKIRMRAIDEDGQPVKLKAAGFLARVIQHEIDHLNGTLFVDHIQHNQSAFYNLTPDGKLEKMPYEQVEKLGIFRD